MFRTLFNTHWASCQSQVPSSNEEYSCAFASNKYFALCGVGGLLACGSTHLLVTPLDIVKCRLQVDQEKYRNVMTGFRVTVAEEGLRGLAKGWVPTLIGYSIQGYAKFGFYEVFKVKFASLVSEESAYKYRTSIYLVSAATAEFIGDVGLSAFEAIKVKIQTSPGFANTMMEAIPKMYQEEGLYSFFKALVPLALRQIPYTTVKFVCFERTIELLYKYVVPKPRDQCSKPEQLVVTFSAGYIAGIFCAVASHPPDVIVSQMNQQKDVPMATIIRRLGFSGMWSGLAPRIAMIGTIAALQWFIFDGFKVAMALPRPPPPEMPESMKRQLTS